MPSRVTYYIQAGGAVACVAGLLWVVHSNPKAAGLVAFGLLVFWAGGYLREKKIL